MVIELVCRDTVWGTLEGEQMYMVDPRSVSELSCDLVCLDPSKLPRTGRDRVNLHRFEKSSVASRIILDWSSVRIPRRILLRDSPVAHQIS